MSSDESSQQNKHEEFVLYRCTDCGKVSVSVGWLHAHIESKHFGFGPWNIIPDPRKMGNFDADMTKTDVIRVTHYEHADIGEVNVNA
jgi:hypothetical protein